MMIVDLAVCDIRHGHAWTWMNGTVHVCLHPGLLCASLLELRPEILLGRAFENCDGSIHILQDGTLNQVFDSLGKLLDLEFCLCGQAIFGDGPRIF
jgi:hypothetical protein